jgi:hypothetical protein
LQQLGKIGCNLRIGLIGHGSIGRRPILPHRYELACERAQIFERRCSSRDVTGFVTARHQFKPAKASSSEVAAVREFAREAAMNRSAILKASPGNGEIRAA